MALNWSVLSGSFKSTGYEDIYSATYSYSQTKSLKAAYTALKSNANSAKNSTEAGKVSARLATLNNSIASSISSVNSYSAWYTADGKSSKISDLAKEAGKKMYEATTGTGTVVDEEV